MAAPAKPIRVALAATALVAALAASLLILFYRVGDRVGTQSGALSESLNETSEQSSSPVSFPTPDKTMSFTGPDDITLNFRTAGEYFYKLQNGVWNCTFLKGVNMGLTLPTTDLNNPDIPYDTYRAWFDHIAKMNANTVKVFTIMNPDFYRAFSDYNAQNIDSPLYLIQGVWFNESYMYEIGDAFGQNEQIIKSFERGVREATDIIHGNSDYTSYGKIKNAVYDRDISDYVAGFVLGLEWQPDFVKNTNDNNAGMEQYTGDFLATRNAEPFEIFLARVGDTLIKYQTSNYSHQHPVAFLNWATTDTLAHSNEPFEEEDMVSVNTENIIPTKEYHAGLFAAVDVYPYYPEFISHQPEYLSFKDERGKSNPYRAYLKDLRSQYSVPVIIAEFGVPTSRGIAHVGPAGYSQGGITETQQGEMIVSMARDIALEGYAGAIIFSWQDEWFKQTWNTVKYAPRNAHSRGLNVECAEQRYGIAAYEPGEGQSVCYPDGNISEWQSDTPVFTKDGISLYCKTDEAYLYLMLKLPGFWDSRRYAVALSVSGRGNTHSSEYKLSFSRPVDFLLVLDGRDGTRLLTDAYYDLFYYQHSVLTKTFDRVLDYEKKNSGIFNKINRFYSNEIVLPLNGQVYPPKYYEAGKLTFGNANPSDGSFNSLSDFYAVGGVVELRIPWYLLNVMNAPEKALLDDFYSKGRVTVTAGGDIYMGACETGDNKTLTLVRFDWPKISLSKYHMRLKKSYPLIRDGFANLMSDYSH